MSTNEYSRPTGGNIRSDTWKKIKKITPAVVEKIGPVPTYPPHTLWQLTDLGRAALAADTRTDGVQKS